MDSVRLEVLGVRGGVPCVSERYCVYGGNTSCFALRYGEQLLVLDGGTGLSALRPRRLWTWLPAPKIWQRN